MSTAKFSIILFFSASLYAQSFGGLSRPAAVDYNSVPLMSASGDELIGFGAQRFLEPSSTDRDPTNSIVSLHELQHPIPTKALREAYQAQQLVKVHRVAQAIAKLEHAIRIAPEFRDAHWNLGALYARIGRSADAQPHFKKALEIGPPAAAIYTNLALTSLTQGQPREAEVYAQKALELEPGNGIAKRILENHLTN